MIILVNLCILLASVALHIYCLIQYVLQKDNKYLKGFANTAIANIILAGSLTVIAVFRPDYLRSINLRLIIWFMSGIVTIGMLMVKINIVRKIIKRSKDPANYHFNFFGKKVLHENVVLKGEVITFYVTIPFFLLSGAYFLARLLNLIMYKHL